MEQNNIIKLSEQAIISLSFTTILLDFSSSMYESVDGKTKHERLMYAIQPYKQHANFISFATHVHNGIMDWPSGNTNMTEAFKVLATKPIHSRRKILVISDGQPNNKESAMTAGLSLETPIDCIYIGNGGDSGEFFMKELAYRSGGTQITVEQAQIKLLNDRISGLLEPPNSGAISL